MFKYSYLAIISFSWLPPQTVLANEALKSPYFIDGVHCEGLEDKSVDEQIANLFVDEELARLGVKAQNQTKCENIFSRFGIEKFNWVTPEDLEKFRFGLTRFGKFKSVDVRIEKSELQNHVHVKVRFEQLEPQNYYRFNFAAGVDEGGDSGQRDTSRTEAEFSYQQRGRENQSRFRVGVKSVTSSARSPLTMDELSKGNKHVVLNEQESATQAKPKWNYDEIFFKLPMSSDVYGVPVEMRFGLNQSRLSQDETSDANTDIEISSIYQPDMFVPMKYRFSLLYSSYSALGSDVVKKDNGSDGRSSKQKQIVFARLMQDFETKLISGHASFSRSITNDLHYYYDYDVRLRVLEWSGFVGSLGAAADAVYGAVLPEHRFGLPHRASSDLYVMAEQRFQAYRSENRLALKCGLRHLGSTKYSDKTSYRQEQKFAELSLTTRLESIDVGLSFVYGDKRLY